MNQTIKITISIIGIILAILSVYFGSILPYQKAKFLINAMSDVSRGVSIDDFEKTYSFQLDYYSPVGQDESVKQLGNTTLTFLSGQKNLPRGIIDRLLQLNHKYFDPVIEKGRAGNFSQDILLMGQLYEAAGFQTRETAMVDKAAEYFNLGLKYSPNRPQFLQGLYLTAKSKNDIEGVKKYGQEIIKLWPTEEKIKKELEALK